MTIHTKPCDDLDAVSTLAEKAMSCIDKYRVTAKEDDRISAVEAATALTRSLEKPADAIYELFLSPTILMAIKTAADLGIFYMLSATVSFINSDQLAAPSSADVHLVERIMRTLVVSGFATERGPGEYISTARSKEMTHRTTIALVNSLFTDFLPVVHKTPEFLEKTGYQNPGDPQKSSLQYAYNTSLSCWDWLAQNPSAFERFNTYMEDTGEVPLLVDVAGGRGHELVTFKKWFPDVRGELVLEDLPCVIADIRSLDASIRRVGHDIFTPQPIKGARAYYMKHIMHDWSDDHCKIILGHIAAAMKKGYSKLLIEDHILPDQGPRSMETLLDMIVMVACAGNERTRQRWIELLESVGLEVKKFWLPDGAGLGIVEAELKDTPV